MSSPWTDKDTSFQISLFVLDRAQYGLLNCAAHPVPWCWSLDAQYDSWMSCGGCAHYCAISRLYVRPMQSTAPQAPGCFFALLSAWGDDTLCVGRAQIMELRLTARRSKCWCCNGGSVAL